MPLTFEALQGQRYRWCFGGIQILRMHCRSLLPGRPSKQNRLSTGQRWAYLSGAVQWYGDLLGLVFLVFLLAGAANLATGGGELLRKLTAFLVATIPVLVGLGLVRAVALLRRGTGASWRDAIGAFFIWRSTSLVVARASVLGLFARKAAFLRTPKTSEQAKWWEAPRANWAEPSLALLGMLGIAAALTRATQLSGPLLAGPLLFPTLGMAAAPFNQKISRPRQIYVGTGCATSTGRPAELNPESAGRAACRRYGNHARCRGPGCPGPCQHGMPSQVARCSRPVRGWSRNRRICGGAPRWNTGPMSLAREAFGTACSSYQSRSLTLWLLDSLAPKELIRTILDKVREVRRLLRKVGSAIGSWAVPPRSRPCIRPPIRGCHSRTGVGDPGDHREALMSTATRAGMERPIFVAIGGDSGSGKSTLTAGFYRIFPADQITSVCLDDYHSLDRRERSLIGVTALDPRANNFALMENQLLALRRGPEVPPSRRWLYSRASGAAAADPPVEERR